LHHCSGINGCLERESLDDGAGSVLDVGIAAGNQACQLAAQMAQRTDTRVDQAQLGGGQLSRRTAREAPLQGEQACGLRKRKSHRLRTFDEAQSVGVRLGVPPDAAGGPQGFGHEFQLVLGLAAVALTTGTT